MPYPLPFRPRLLPLLLVLALGGCATKEFVQEEVGLVHRRIDDLGGLLGKANQRIDGQLVRIEATEKRILNTEQGARELGQRADQTQGELARTGQRLDAVSEGLKSAHQRLDSHGTDIARTKDRLTQVESGLGVARQETAGALALLAQAENRLSGLESRINPANKMEGAAATAPEAATRAAPLPPLSTATGSLSDALRRLDEIAARIAQADKRLDATSQTLSSASARIDGVEASLSETRKRVETGEVGLRETNRTLGAAQGELARVEQRVTVNTEAIAGVAKRVDGAEGALDKAKVQIAGAEQALAAANDRLARSEATQAQLSATALEALDRALAAGKLAEGKLVYESALTEELTGFAAYQAALSEEAKQVLKQMADKLLAENKNIYIEIQGHTDTSGKAARNLVLSRERAEAVRNYLHNACGIPLHRLAVAAYGGDKPVADNASKEGRARNRRVVVVVLK
jgi:outer membrane protein OmpA-like peptidoglycan-associated protein